MILGNRVANQNIPVRLISPSGVPLRGMNATNLRQVAGQGSVLMVKPDGTLVELPMDGTTFVEVDPNRAPGLYHVVPPTTAIDIDGPFQLAVVAANGEFDPVIDAGDVSSVATDAELARKVLLGSWKIDTIAKTFTIFDDDLGGGATIKTFTLKDAAGNPSTTSILERSSLASVLPTSGS